MAGFATTSVGFNPFNLNFGKRYNVDKDDKYTDYEDTEYTSYDEIDMSKQDDRAWYEKVGDALSSVGSTLAVGATSIVSGIADVGESLVDGTIWLGGTIASGATSIFDEDLANDIREGTMDVIAYDAVGEANKAFYENTEIGKAINDASIYSYDSRQMQGVRNISKYATEFAGATAITVATGGLGGVALAGATGFVAGSGDMAEALFQDEENRDYGRDSGLIALSGLGNAVSWAAMGRTGSSVSKAVSVMKETGVKQFFSTSLANIKDLLKSVDLKSLANNKFILSMLKNTFKDPDFYLDTLGVSANNISEAYAMWIKTGEFNLNWKNLAAELGFAGALNFFAGGVQSLADLKKPFKDFNIETKLARYNELMKTAMSEDYIKYMDNVANGYAVVLNAEYDEVSRELSQLTREIDDYVTYINNEALVQNSPHVELSLKQDILSNCDLKTDELTKARQLYLELNKRMNYDINYYKGTDEMKALIYNQPVSFDTLKGNAVVCKGWSELYQELLIESGFDPNQVRIMGGNNVNNHKWIEITLKDGNIIIADATDAINHSIDLSNCKGGFSTNGFFYADPSYSGARLNKLQNLNLEEIGKQWLGMDQSIGYASGNYQAELLQKADNAFSNSSLYNSVFGGNSFEKALNNMINMEIPKNMDGYDTYGYFNKVKRAMFSPEDASKININLSFRQTELGTEAVTLISGPNNYAIYSSSTGRHVFTDFQEYMDFINTLGLFR